MKINPHVILTGIVYLLLMSVSAQDETKKCPKPTTESKQLSATILIKDQTPIKIIGEASFTLTAMNWDESLAGIFNFTLPDKERQKSRRRCKKISMTSPPLLA